jgi:hypothetical protein
MTNVFWEALDPCNACKVVSRIMCLIVLFFILGAFGKAVLIYGGKSDATALQILEDRNIYVPDLRFLISGLAGVVILWAIGAIFGLFCMSLKNCVHFLCCRACCREGDDPELVRLRKMYYAANSDKEKDAVV